MHVFLVLKGTNPPKNTGGNKLRHNYKKGLVHEPQLRETSLCGST